MARTVVAGNLTVIFGMLILVSYQHGNRSACGPSLEHAGKNLHGITLTSLGCKTALSRFSPVQVPLNIFFRQRQTGGTTVHYHTDAGPVGLSPSGHRQNSAIC